ncbi:hypothetical protein TNCV_4480561 [Trichonephila clavipes]|nr:hypothetical protein TNCV_4480561 [Trichonephila clavipes]
MYAGLRNHYEQGCVARDDAESIRHRALPLEKNPQIQAMAYCAYLSIRDDWALRCMSRCPDQHGFKKQLGDSRLLNEGYFIELITVYDNKEVEDEVQLLTADLIHEGLTFATSMEQLVTNCRRNVSTR